jgi:hypothetical protein
MTGCEGLPFGRQPPEPASNTGRQPRALQSIVSPTRSVLVDSLDATRQHLLPLHCVQSQRISGGFVNIARCCTVGMISEVTENGLDELVVCWDCHRRVLCFAMMEHSVSVDQLQPFSRIRVFHSSTASSNAVWSRNTCVCINSFAAVSRSSHPSR